MRFSGYKLESMFCINQGLKSRRTLIRTRDRDNRAKKSVRRDVYNPFEIITGIELTFIEYFLVTLKEWRKAF